MTSHDVVRRIRRLFHTRKVGHAGTLDPLATGVLPVALGQATKILQFLLAEKKSYRATFQLGVTTDTLDRDGTLVAQKPVPDQVELLLEQVCSSLLGEIEQIPPMYSALKQNGVPLYKLAREGKVVERKARQIFIERLEIIDIKGDNVTIEVDCSKGTYVRSLIADIGESIGCGACLTELCRLSTGLFRLDECITLEELQKLEDPTAHLLSPASTLRDSAVVELSAKAMHNLSFGIPPQLSETVVLDDLQEGSLVKLMTNDQLAAIAHFAPLRQKEQRGDFELIRVFVSY